jgi:ubiquinone/menaquinone biosynthesis C-methylase UbiE
MPEVNLMVHYPKRTGRQTERPVITEEDKRLARQFGRDYFDGLRRHGYGGYAYHPRFWTETVRYMREYYHLSSDAAILDVGCAKGFMLYDFSQLMPDARLTGVDVSEYAVANALEAMRPYIRTGNAVSLEFPDQSFDLVLAINTIHNLPYDECKRSLQEIQRVSRRNAFVMVDAYRTEAERKAMLAWVLTAQTMLHVEDWLKLFAEAGYTGDYYWWTVQ